MSCYVFAVSTSFTAVVGINSFSIYRWAKKPRWNSLDVSAKRWPKTVKFGILLSAPFHNILLKIKQLCDLSKPLLTTWHFFHAYWRDAVTSSKHCHSFHRHIANGQESRRRHRTKVNSAYYCQQVLGDGCWNTFVKDARATRGPPSRTAIRHTLQEHHDVPATWERHVHWASEQSGHNSSRLSCLGCPSTDGVPPAATHFSMWSSLCRQ